MTTATIAKKLGVTEAEYIQVEDMAYAEAKYDWEAADSEGRWRLRSYVTPILATPAGRPYARAYAATILALAGE